MSPAHSAAAAAVQDNPIWTNNLAECILAPGGCLTGWGMDVKGVGVVVAGLGSILSWFMLLAGAVLKMSL